MSDLAVSCRHTDKQLIGEHSQNGDADSLFRVIASCVNDKSLGRGPYIRERIAGNECQLRVSRLMEDLDVGWINDLDCVHHVAKYPVGRRHEDFIVTPQVAQRAKERIAMSGDSHISRRSRKSRAVDVSGRRSEDLRSRAFENHDGKMKAGDFDSSHRLSGPGRNDDEGTRKRLGVTRVRIALHLVIEEAARSTLRAGHVPFDVPKTGNGECAPN
ncbi:MAG TPA: hypothetical protein VMS37_03685 [Verrucomicrobiae bacterium]|nr:hypothetical protein [Verrucomicrobiae bacterium]